MQNYIIAIIMHADILSLIIVLTALDVKDIASFLIDQIALCLREADRHKLRSAAQASVWAAFHRMWERKNISDRWSSFMTNLPSPVEETSLGLQLILDRLLRNTIQNQAAQPGNVSTAAVARPLDKLEINVIHYMAGYIAVKLLKKYRKKHRCQVSEIRSRDKVSACERLL